MDGLLTCVLRAGQKSIPHNNSDDFRDFKEFTMCVDQCNSDRDLYYNIVCKQFCRSSERRDFLLKKYTTEKN